MVGCIDVSLLTIKLFPEGGEMRGYISEVERGGARDVARLGHGQRAPVRQRAAARPHVCPHYEVQECHVRLLRLET